MREVLRRFAYTGDKTMEINEKQHKNIFLARASVTSKNGKLGKDREKDFWRRKGSLISIERDIPRLPEVKVNWRLLDDDQQVERVVHILHHAGVHGALAGALGPTIKEEIKNHFDGRIEQNHLGGEEESLKDKIYEHLKEGGVHSALTVAAFFTKDIIDTYFDRNVGL